MELTSQRVPLDTRNLDKSTNWITSQSQIMPVHIISLSLTLKSEVNRVDLLDTDFGRLKDYSRFRTQTSRDTCRLQPISSDSDVQVNILRPKRRGLTAMEQATPTSLYTVSDKWQRTSGMAGGW